jgi:hypothetical protein
MVAPSAVDESNLDTLAICHYVYAGLVGLVGMAGLLYVVIGVVIATGTAAGSTSPGTPSTAAVGGVIAAIGGLVTVLLWLKAAFVLWSGLSLKKRQRRTLSFVVACICCVSVPLGTLLGVFTLVVLSRPQVRAIYDRVAY